MTPWHSKPINDLATGLAENPLHAPCGIMGDDAYNAHGCVVIQHSGSDLDEYEDEFNFYMSRTRISVERAFGVFKKRWHVFGRTSSGERQAELSGTAQLPRNGACSVSAPHTTWSSTSSWRPMDSAYFSRENFYEFGDSRYDDCISAVKRDELCTAREADMSIIIRDKACKGLKDMG